jgi:hypothetical protein
MPRSHLAYLALVEGVIRQFDDICLTAAHSPRYVQDEVRAAHASEELANDRPAASVSVAPRVRLPSARSSQVDNAFGRGLFKKSAP